VKNVINVDEIAHSLSTRVKRWSMLIPSMWKNVVFFSLRRPF